MLSGPKIIHVGSLMVLLERGPSTASTMNPGCVALESSAAAARSPAHSNRRANLVESFLIKIDNHHPFANAINGGATTTPLPCHEVASENLREPESRSRRIVGADPPWIINCE